jgi:hypothetical protein
MDPLDRNAVDHERALLFQMSQTPNQQALPIWIPRNLKPVLRVACAGIIGATQHQIRPASTFPRAPVSIGCMLGHPRIVGTGCRVVRASVRVMEDEYPRIQGNRSLTNGGNGI